MADLENNYDNDSKEDNSRTRPPQGSYRPSYSGRGRGRQDPHVAKALYNFGVTDLRELLNKKHSQDEQERSKFLKRRSKSNERKPNPGKSQTRSKSIERQTVSKKSSVIQNPSNIRVELSTTTGQRYCVIDGDTILADIMHVPDHQFHIQALERGIINKNPGGSTRSSFQVVNERDEKSSEYQGGSEQFERRDEHWRRSSEQWGRRGIEQERSIKERGRGREHWKRGGEQRGRGGEQRGRGGEQRGRGGEQRGRGGEQCGRGGEQRGIGGEQRGRGGQRRGRGGNKRGRDEEQWKRGGEQCRKNGEQYERCGEQWEMSGEPHERSDEQWRDNQLLQKSGISIQNYTNIQRGVMRGRRSDFHRGQPRGKKGTGRGGRRGHAHRMGQDNISNKDNETNPDIQPEANWDHECLEVPVQYVPSGEVEQLVDNTFENKYNAFEDDDANVENLVTKINENLIITSNIHGQNEKITTGFDEQSFCPNSKELHEDY